MQSTTPDTTFITLQYVRSTAQSARAAAVPYPLAQLQACVSCSLQQCSVSTTDIGTSFDLLLRLSTQRSAAARLKLRVPGTRNLSSQPVYARKLMHASCIIDTVRDAIKFGSVFLPYRCWVEGAWSQVLHTLRFSNQESGGAVYCGSRRAQ
jgi:hypothetical protein